MDKLLNEKGMPKSVQNCLTIHQHNAVMPKNTIPLMHTNSHVASIEGMMVGSAMLMLVRTII